MSEKYTVITTNTHQMTAQTMTRDILLDRLNSGVYDGFEQLKQIPDFNMELWGDAMLIVRGEVVVPVLIANADEYLI